MIEEVRAYCLNLKGVEEGIKWEEHLCFTVGKKMFFVINPDHYPVNGSFKTTLEKFQEFKEVDGFSPAPYLARYQWIAYDDLTLLPLDDWQEIIDLAYQLIFDKLPKKTRMQITEN